MFTAIGGIMNTFNYGELHQRLDVGVLTDTELAALDKWYERVLKDVEMLGPAYTIAAWALRDRKRITESFLFSRKNY